MKRDPKMRLDHSEEAHKRHVEAQARTLHKLHLEHGAAFATMQFRTICDTFSFTSSEEIELKEAFEKLTKEGK